MAITEPITEGQEAWLRNNSEGWSFDEIASLTKEQAFDIINRAKSQGINRNSFATDFWNEIKKEINERGNKNV